MDRHRPGPHPISRREFLRGAAGVSLTALLAACTGQAPGSRVPSRSAGPGTAAGSSGAAAGSALPTDLPAEVLLRLWRGYHPERSGRMILVPRGFAYMDGGISHSVPWRYMQHVPMFWYGPGIVRAQGAL
ncbi:MAG: twin-arginine translocation signal domain-containing protein, partial [Actinobacteria bacterium]|nr:twin-arginine translocation signal domain-containing protein [Actinomycetota bacterium]